MSHSKTKFNNNWLKKKDSNGHLLEWWYKSHDSSKLCANYVTRKFKLQTMVVLLLCNMHKQKAVVQSISEAKTSKVVVASTSTSEPKTTRCCRTGG